MTPLDRLQNRLDILEKELAWTKEIYEGQAIQNEELTRENQMTQHLFLERTAELIHMQERVEKVQEELVKKNQEIRQTQEILSRRDKEFCQNQTDLAIKNRELSQTQAELKANNEVLARTSEKIEKLFTRFEEQQTKLFLQNRELLEARAEKEILTGRIRELEKENSDLKLLSNRTAAGFYFAGVLSGAGMMLAWNPFRAVQAMCTATAL